jgi:hypothetical protein
LGTHRNGYVIAAAVVIALTTARLTGVLVQRGFGVIPTIVVTMAFVASPPVLQMISVDLECTLGLALVALGLDGIASFVGSRSTEAGFRAGLAFGLAVMIEPDAWPYVLAIGLGAPLIARRAGHRGASSGMATIAVLIFPAVAAITFWWYLAWWFSRLTFGGIEHHVHMWFITGAGPAAATASGILLHALASAPLFVAAAAIKTVTDPWRLAAPAIAIAGMWLAQWFGVATPSGQAYGLLMFLYIINLAAMSPNRRRKQLIVAVAVLQIALVWWISVYSGMFSLWLRT